MHEVKTIDLGDVTLAYREYGSGDKYLLSTQNFFFKDSHMALLGQPPYDYHCFLIYMRGYNQSTHYFDGEPREYVHLWGQDLIRFAEAMGIKSFYYTGISHGNWGGWYVAFNRPEMVRAFVCCDGCGGYMDRSKLPEPHRATLDEVQHLVGNYEELSKRAWIEKWPTENPQRLARRQSNWEEHTDILMHRSAEEFCVPMGGDMTGCNATSDEDYFEHLKKIPFPVLIWEGGLDPLCTAERALKTAQTIPGGQLLLYQHLGHGGADEMPELTARDCDRFFKDTEGRIL